MRTPPEETIIERLAQKPRGGSGNNPYLTPQIAKRYTMTIDPYSLAKRIMSVREQVAEEWRQDLLLVTAENMELVSLRLA